MHYQPLHGAILSNIAICIEGKLGMLSQCLHRGDLKKYSLTISTTWWSTWQSPLLGARIDYLHCSFVWGPSDRKWQFEWGKASHAFSNVAWGDFNFSELGALWDDVEKIMHFRRGKIRLYYQIFQHLRKILISFLKRTVWGLVMHCYTILQWRS